MDLKLDQIYDRLYQSAFGLGIRILPGKGPQVVSGAHALNRINEILEKEGKLHPMIVTGPRIVKSEFFVNACGTLKEYSLFSDVRPDPDTKTVEKIAAMYTQERCDCFVAIGGGSNMDAAKAASARIARRDRTLQEMGGTLKVRRRTPLFLAVPTTAGTGSECTVAAVVTDPETHHKYSINDFVLCPDYAILDPVLTVSLPPFLTATTGMDALTHAVEAYLNRPYHRRETPGQCREAVRAIFRYLPEAFKKPDNLKARQEMLFASFKAGLAFTTACVGNVHAAAHTIGGLYHVPHGLANAVLLPIVLEDYGKKVERPLADLARFAHIAAGTDSECAAAFIQKIRDMNRTFGIPDHIEKISEDDLDQMASWAVQEANPLYPVPVIYDREHFKRILRRVGQLS